MTTLRDESVCPHVTTGPISGSRKVYTNGVPTRRIQLTNGDHFDVYDTSGPYTDDTATIDLTRGLPRPRAEWIAGRGTGTQLSWAKAGVLTDEMRFVAAREDVDPEFVRAEVAAGRAVLPANKRHPEIEPMIIGRNFLVKINANI